jgi:ATP-dependent DNA helicase RecQ
MQRAEAICRDVFGHDALHPHQRDVLEHVFAGRDCLAVLPTGSGKSLCYALPALVRPGLTLVVSPLIALIRDQVRRFAARGVPVAAFDSLQTPEEKDAVWRKLDEGALRLVFVSPERMARYDFRERLKTEGLGFVAIDEAHCVSHWGSHFRPDYRMLGENLEALAGARPQKLALTATATSKVRLDIETRLKLATPALVFEDFFRKNLELKVIRADKNAEQLSAVLNGVLSMEGQGIVYAPTRKVVEEVQRMLRQARVEAVAYHGGMAAEQRSIAHRRFADGSARVVVATHAFGMGIDKADIRFVHHVGMPGSIEQYIQEIGRAGRDGLPARCWLIYGPRDYHVQKFMIDKSFPAPDALERALGTALELVRNGAMASEQAVVRGIARQLGEDERAAREALDLLCREGLLSALRRSGGSGVSEVLLAEGATGEVPRFFAEYPLRKAENLAKLDAMKAYAGGGDDRMRLIEDYFRH